MLEVEGGYNPMKFVFQSPSASVASGSEKTGVELSELAKPQEHSR